MRVYNEKEKLDEKTSRVTLCVDIVGKVIGGESLSDIIESDALFAIDRYVEAIRVLVSKGWRIDLTNFSNPRLAAYSLQTLVGPRFPLRYDSPEHLRESMVMLVNIRDKDKYDNAMRAFYKQEIPWGIVIMKKKNADKQKSNEKK
jgi:hypothetical protein